VFVSFDIDSVRAADCPGVSAPGNLGLTAEDAFLMSYLAGAHPQASCSFLVHSVSPLASFVS
jgi:arginase family enzyme